MVLTHDTEKYGKSHTPKVPVVSDRLDEAQRILRDTPGCTVLIYDQPCSKLRRDHRRGKVMNQQWIFNEAV